MEQFCWIYGGWCAKPSWINYQVDFGNLAVGLGTFAVAVASVFIALRSSKSQSNSRIAAFRMEWLNQFREDVAKYIRAHRNLHLVYQKENSNKTNETNRELLLDLIEIRSRLRMMMNPESKDTNESEFLKYIQQDVSDQRKESKAQREKIVNLAVLIEKSVWSKVKTEILN